MSIDHYYTQQDGKWVRIDDYVFSKEWRDDERPDFHTDFWVDLAHGGRLIHGSVLIMDERYYFSDREAAIDFYLEGWKVRQALDDDGKGIGLDHSGLYLGGA